MTMTEPGTILVVDDDDAHRTMLNTLLSGWGYHIFETEDGSGAITAVQEKPFDLVLMDVRMLKVSGLEALERIKAFNPSIPVIIMTAYSSVDTAVDALKKGAYDYLNKPLDFEKLKLTLTHAMEHVHLKEENTALKARLDDQLDLQNVIGRSPVMVRLLETAGQVAPSEATVVIHGQSGTGKEMIANIIHHNSPRKHRPFVKVNCAAITETLFEAELFGHEKGAYTGAHKQTDGCFLRAQGGSLFLDEISEIPLPMQVKLLRVLQERELTRVGGETLIKIDVRLVAATNQDLAELVQQGRFRQDLYYRLNVVALQVPSLKDRKEDIPLLAQHFLARFKQSNRKQIKGFTPAAMDLLLRYQWPGNVRELMNAVERAVVLARGEYLDKEDLAGLHGPNGPPAAVPDEPSASGQSLDQLEKSAILRMLQETGGNKSKAARRLGITRKTLHKKLKQYESDGTFNAIKESKPDGC
jgi:two-component system response regulator HydG